MPSDTHILVLDGWQPRRLNELMRLSRHPRNAALKADAQVIAVECRNQGIPRATGKRRLSVVIRYTRRGRGDVDADALLKSLLDGLKACGVLLDDSRRGLELGSVTHEECERHGVVCVIEEVQRVLREEGVR